MTTLLRKAGIPSATNYTIYARQAVLSDSAGKAIAVVVDPNDASAAAGYGDQSGTTKAYFYESTNRSSWTLINTVSFTVNLDKSATYDAIYSVAIADDDSIKVAYRGNGGHLRFISFTAATYTKVDDVQIVAAVAGKTWVAVDIATKLTQDGSKQGVLVAAQYEKPGVSGDRFGHQVFRRKPSDGSWVSEYSQIDNTTTDMEVSPNVSSMISVTILNAATDAAMRYVVSFSNVSGTTDHGWKYKVYDTNVETGSPTLVLASAASDASTLTPGSSSWVTSKIRVLDVFPTTGNGNGFVIAMSSFTDHRPGRDGVHVIKYYDRNGALVYSNSVALVGELFRPGHATYNSSLVNFRYQQSNASLGKAIYSRIFRAQEFPIQYVFDNAATTRDCDFISGCGYYTDDVGVANIATRHDALFLVQDGTAREWRVETLAPSRAPAEIQTPPASSTTITSEPSLAAKADLDRKYPQAKYKMVWQLANNAGFTGGSLRTIYQADSKFATVSGTDAAGVTVTFSDVVPTAQALTQGLWYLRAAHIDEFGIQGAWTAYQTFTVSHPPSAVGVSPTGAQVQAYGSGNVTFDWNFSDPWPNDSQTAFQVIVERVDDGSTAYDSGKVTSTATAHTGNITSGHKDTLLRWKVRAYDEDDVVGAYSTPQLFVLGDPPTVAINSPTSITAVSAPSVNADFTPTTYGGRTITHIAIQVFKGEVLAFASGWTALPAPSASGVPITYSSGVGVYENNQNYTMLVYVHDSAGLESVSSVYFSTHWIPPACASGLAVDESQFNVESAAYVELVWDDSARDVDFVNWRVYRRVDEINPNTQLVVETGTWEAIYDAHEIETGYTYRDYYAPSSQKVNYRVGQVVNRFGDLIESEDIDSVSAFTVSDGYWLLEPLGPDLTAGSFRLSIVTGDSYSDEYDSSEFTIYGRGRYVDKGDHLGLKGQLDAQLRDTGGTTARQKKRRLEELQAENRDLYLRTPFGDIYRVAIGNLNVGRISGVGQSEFVDLGIPYSEVAP